MTGTNHIRILLLSPFLFLTLPSPHMLASATVAAFDLDCTLVQPKSGNKFPKNRCQLHLLLKA